MPRISPLILSIAWPKITWNFLESVALPITTKYSFSSSASDPVHVCSPVEKLVQSASDHADLTTTALISLSLKAKQVAVPAFALRPLIDIVFVIKCLLLDTKAISVVQFSKYQI